MIKGISPRVYLRNVKTNIFWGKPHQGEGGREHINSQSLGQYRPTYPSYIAGRNVMPNWRKIITIIVTTKVRIDI